MDPFSSGISFGAWKEYENVPFMTKPPPTYEPLIVYLPKTWLLREGWRKSGPISMFDVPRTRPVLETR